jgi:VWFA-related protein
MANFLKVTAIICLLIPAVNSQTQTAASVRQDTMSFVFGVFDKNDEPIPDLRQEQFNITDNGQPAEVIGIESSSKIPLYLGILIDSSSSSRRYLANEKQAATFLAEHLVHSPDDRAFVVAFDQVWDVVQDFTNDVGSLKQKIEGIRTGGGTAVWDVLYFACRDKLLKQSPDGPVRRTIILFSDGNDNQSHVTREEVLKMALRAGVTIYVIAPDAGRAEDTLRKLGTSTGGEAFFPGKPAEWAAAVNHIQRDLQSQYAATYKTTMTPVNQEFHTLKVTINEPTLKVRALQGYFSPKP